MRYKTIFGSREEQIESAREAGATIVEATDCQAVAALSYTAASPKPWAATVWAGKKEKPFFQSAKTMDEAEAVINGCFEAQRKTEHLRKEKRDGRKAVNAPDFWQVGDVVVNSWGYDQTNVNFYQVTSVKARMVEIRPIAQNTNDDGGPQGGKCAPVRYQFTGEAVSKRVMAGGCISFPCGSGSKWNGRAVRCSSYA